MHDLRDGNKGCTIIVDNIDHRYNVQTGTDG